MVSQPKESDMLDDLLGRNHVLGLEQAPKNALPPKARGSGGKAFLRELRDSRGERRLWEESELWFSSDGDWEIEGLAWCYGKFDLRRHLAKLLDSITVNP